MDPLKLNTDGTPIIPDPLPEGATLEHAKAGQYLCEIAVKNFPECSPQVREVNTHLTDKAVLEDGDPVVIPPKTEKQEQTPNEDELKAKVDNFPPPFVKFAGQGTTRLEKNRHNGLTRVGISNYVTNKAGYNGRGISEDFYTEHGMVGMGPMHPKELSTHADPDHFRIEVYDNRAYKDGDAEVTVTLQVLQPLYKRETEDSKKYIVRDKKALDKVSAPDVQPEPGFKIPANADRKLEVKCKKVEGCPSFYRSKYMRLVTHKKDKDAATEQTLYVGDYYDETALTADERRYTEILEQKVRARYTPKMCKAKKCRAEAIAEVGELNKEVVFAVNIFDDACDYEAVRRTIYGQVRRVYAQAHIRPVIKEVTKYPPPLKNIVRVGKRTGTTPLASGVVTGTTKSTITVKITGQTNDVKLNPTKDQSAKQVAASLCTKIEQNATGSDPSLHTKVLVEPESGGSPVPEAQRARSILVFTDSECRKPATITSATSDDSRLPAQVCQITSDMLKNVPSKYNGLEMRLLRLYCRSDPHLLDALLIPAFKTETYHVGTTVYTSTTFGMGLPVWIDLGVCIFVASERMKESPHDTRYTFAHEVGHVIMNCGHIVLTDAGEVNPPAAPDRRDPLMVTGGEAHGDAAEVTGRRRIMDAPLEIPCMVWKADGGKYKIKKIVGIVETEVESAVVTMKDGTPQGTAVSRCSGFTSAPALAGPSARREVATEW
ncbi:MAG: hypothetical protein KAV82_11260 [Phycisphaerae bacterium]|nr:hypothetical protein [Phycisphaerae bacterium]